MLCRSASFGHAVLGITNLSRRLLSKGPDPTWLPSFAWGVKTDAGQGFRARAMPAMNLHLNSVS